MRRSWRKQAWRKVFKRNLARAVGGAVAPTVAISLFALVAMGGVAFDYARLASMDSELQNAADQAALAGASQLDKEAGAILRATAAAQSLIANQTIMANDGNLSGNSITIPVVVFYATKADAENNTNPVTSDATARFVRVEVQGREAFYALTPVVGAFRSGNIGAQAVAGLGSAICRIPPVMICNPQETGTNTDFDAAAIRGYGIKLVSVGNGSGAWVPGNFGYLDNGSSGGANGIREALGWDTPPGNCFGDSGVDMKTGANTSVTDALNTRFDIYDSNQSCLSPGSCPASIDSVKDVVRSGNANGGNACRLHNAGWGEADSGRYLPTSATVALDTTITPTTMGHPRDMCHAISVNGACSYNGVSESKIGDGNWDRDAYFRSHYRRPNGSSWTSGDETVNGSWRKNTGLPANATRFEVNDWEIANRGVAIDNVTVLDPRITSGNGNSAKRAYGKPVCSQVQNPSYGTGTIPSATARDRRRLSVAVINCMANNVHGSAEGVPVEKWAEVFLVQPSINRVDGRTNAGDVYVEMIREIEANNNATVGQVLRRDVPYLVK